MAKRKRPSVAAQGLQPPRSKPSSESISVLRASPHRVEDAGNTANNAKIPRRGRHATSQAAVSAAAAAAAAGQGEHVLHPPGAPGGGGAVAAGPSADLRCQPGNDSSSLQGPDTTRKHVKAHSASDKTVRPDPPSLAEVQLDDNITVGATIDPEATEGPHGEDELENEEEVREALFRPPPVNSDILPLPWKGRLGYACLNTYLRNANPPVFSSRTCRIASIIEHRHPLKDPSQPEHATKNRPDKDQPADIERGSKYVQDIGLANVRDIIKMVRWNDRFGIRFMRLSSEMFPFASHPEYGYQLAPFASDALAEAGRVVAELGHRVTTHPGQFTQLGSPRKPVIDNAIRDLTYHDEMLSLLKLPPQQDRDAVMILHLGGVFGDKAATLDRFRENYARLSPSIKKRLVLENDDVSWSVHDLLPLCQELNIPLVLDFHHHNIVFDSSKVREGTKDIIEYFPAILETWKRKGITPKMHYSEPCPDAVTARGRRKHSPRVMTLPPCPNDMDLMIEAKDKEQAVFELMRTFKLPGYDLFNNLVQHVRPDENKPFKPKPKPKAKKNGRKKKVADDLDALDAELEEAEEEKAPPLVPEEEVSMGGPLRQVYWPPGMEHWLRPAKRVVKKKEETVTVLAKKKRKITAMEEDVAAENGLDGDGPLEAASKRTPTKKAAAPRGRKKPAARAVPTPSPSDDELCSSPLSDGDDAEDAVMEDRPAPAPTRKRSGRAARVSYKEEDVD